MPIRIQRKRTKGWKMPENTVYVGRGSRWGNKFKVGDAYGFDAEQVVSCFFLACNGAGTILPKEFAAYLAPLRGKDLACWCPTDKPCHADVLLQLANNESQSHS